MLLIHSVIYTLYIYIYIYIYVIIYYNVINQTLSPIVEGFSEFVYRRRLYRPMFVLLFDNLITYLIM